MVNKVTLIGNVGGDAEIRHLESGTMVGKFSVATNENYMGKDGQWNTVTEWHNIVVWRNLAEKAQNIKKGDMVYIDGKLTTRKWQDKDNNTRYNTDVVANYFRVITKRENMPNSNMQSNTPMNTQSNTAAPSPVKTNPIESAPETDDLPF